MMPGEVCEVAPEGFGAVVFCRDEGGTVRWFVFDGGSWVDWAGCENWSWSEVLEFGPPILVCTGVSIPEGPVPEVEFDTKELVEKMRAVAPKIKTAWKDLMASSTVTASTVNALSGYQIPAQLAWEPYPDAQFIDADDQPF